MNITEMTDALWGSFVAATPTIHGLPEELRTDLRDLLDELVSDDIDQVREWATGDDDGARWDWADSLPSVYTSDAMDALAGPDRQRWLDLMDKAIAEGVVVLDELGHIEGAIWQSWAVGYTMTADDFASLLAAWLTSPDLDAFKACGLTDHEAETAEALFDEWNGSLLGLLVAAPPLTAVQA